jgi:cytochrome oxidase assembly protein ShyY1
VLELLRTRRWIAFTAAAAVAIAAFGMLSLWQWHRAEQKREEFRAVAARMQSGAVTPAAASTDASLEWQRVTVSGTYLPDREQLVRSRPMDGSNGFWVLAPLRTDAGVTWVARGWIPTSGGATAAVAAPAAPDGAVTVTGYARLAEPGPVRAGDDLPAGQVTAVVPAGLSALARTDTPSIWWVVADNDPSLRPLSLPEPTDTRNLSYAGQWLLFAAIAIGGWWFFLRREARDTQAEADQSGASSVPATHV